jgi:diguanylate cyclase (GGDEF)-like protein
MVENTPPRHTLALAASYAALVAIAFAASRSLDMHFGALAVIPLLFIAYYAPASVAVVTAFGSGAALTLFDRRPIFIDGQLDVPAIGDGLILCASLCAAIIISRRLREASNANALLHIHLVRAQHAAQNDPLTGIANRNAFMRALAQALQTATPHNRPAVFFCDLDGFKLVNDTHGHDVGDAILRMACARLTNSVRSEDVVGRIGGDEFAVLARGVRDPVEAAHMAQNIEHAFTQPFGSGGSIYNVGITVGVSVCPDDGSSPEVLLRCADERMYRSKQAKRVARLAVRPSEA